MPTYRCSMHGEDLASGDGREVEATSIEYAAEEYLTEWDDQSIAADIVGNEFDEDHSVEVYVMDPDDEATIFRVEVKLTASIDYNAYAGKVTSLHRTVTEVFTPPPTART